MPSVSAALLDLEQKKLLGSLQADVAALRTAIVAMNVKLDADGGVTDTNYGATTNPPALQTTA